VIVATMIVGSSHCWISFGVDKAMPCMVVVMLVLCRCLGGRRRLLVDIVMFVVHVMA
jgi:hypothetical protein